MPSNEKNGIKILRKLFVFFLLLGNVGSVSSMELSDDAMRVQESSLSYDVGYPLNARIVGSVKFETTTFERFVFDSFHDGAVPGILALPEKGKAPYPVILLMRGLTSSKISWLNDGFSHGSLVTKGLLDKGYAVMALL